MEMVGMNMFNENQKEVLDAALSTFIYEIKKNILAHKDDPGLTLFVSAQQKKLEEATILREQLREENLWSPVK
jgi:hypothetical protein